MIKNFSNLIFPFLLLFCAQLNAQNKPTPPSATAAKPTPPSATAAKPTPPSATAAKPTPPSATAAKPTTPSTTAAKPTTPSTTATKPTTPSTTATKPTTPSATATKPTTPSATKPTTSSATKPTPPSATAAKPTPPSATAAKPTPPSTTATKPTTPNATATKPTTPSATAIKPTTQTGIVGKPIAPKVETAKTVTPTPKKPVKEVEDKGQSDDVEVVSQETDTDYFVKKQNKMPKNVFKLDLIEVLDGTFPLFYERVIAPKFSAQLGVGMTSFTPILAELRPIYSGIYDEDYLGYVKAKTGIYLSIGARYYAGRNTFAPEGAYIAVESQFKQYKFEAESSNGSASGDKTETKITNFDMIRILFGFQGEKYNNFTWEPQIGFGWRKHTYDGLIRDDNFNPIRGSVTSVKPVLVFGFKIGVQF
jgi:hypothetical protein